MNSLSRKHFLRLALAVAAVAAAGSAPNVFAAEDIVEITVAHPYGKIFRPIHQKIIKEFNKIHPNVKVRLETPFPDYEELTQRTLAGIAQGNAPVLSFQGINQIRQYIEMGASWATFGILVPILVPIAYAVDPSMVFVVLGAVLAGSVFGDHSSPISDTSVLSAASSGCPVMEHAATQLPYALLTAFAAGAGYLVSGFTNGNLWVSWGTAVAVLGGGLWWFLSRQTDSVSAAVTVAKS